MGASSLYRILAPVGGLAIACHTAAGQAPSVTVGDRVRIDACETSAQGLGVRERTRTFKGVLVMSDSTHVVLRESERIDTVPVGQIRQLFVSGGHVDPYKKLGKSFLKGALIGAAVGSFFDVVSDNRTGDGSGEALESVLLPMMGAALGAVSGVLLRVAAGSEEWRPVPNVAGADC